MTRSLRLKLLIVAGGALIGTVLIALAQNYRGAFEEWIREDVRARVRLILVALTLLTSGPLIGMSVYCWRAAATRGRVLRALALFSGGSGLLLAVLIWRFLFLLERARE